MIFMDSLQPNVLKQEKRENGMKQEEIRANRIEINVLICQMIVKVNEGIGIALMDNEIKCFCVVLS